MVLVNPAHKKEKWVVNIRQYRIEAVRLIDGFYSERELFSNAEAFLIWCYKMDTRGWVYR